MFGRKGESGRLVVPAVLTLTALAAGCAQNLRTETSGSGVRSAQTTIRVTDNANASVGDLTYYTVDDIVVSEIPGTPNDVWGHLLAAYEAVGLEPDITDAPSLTVGVQEARLRRTLGGNQLSTYLSCGRNMTGNLADRATVRIQMFTVLRAVGEDRTEVRTELTANATDNDGTSRTVRTCTSNHRLEATLARHVTEAVGQGADPGA